MGNKQKVFPSKDEIPDEPLKADEINPFNVDGDNFECMNEFTAAEWKSQSSPEDRIRTVIETTPNPKSASKISDIALVSEIKAKKTLEKLAKEGIAKIHQKDSKRMYSRTSFTQD